MIYVRPPTDEEHAELQLMTRQAVGRVSQHAQGHGAPVAAPL